MSPPAGGDHAGYGATASGAGYVLSGRSVKVELAGTAKSAWKSKSRMPLAGIAEVRLIG